MNRHPALSQVSREDMFLHVKSLVVEGDYLGLAAVMDAAQTTPLKSNLTITDIAIIAGDAFAAKPGGHTERLGKTFIYCLYQDGVDVRALEQRFAGQDEYLAGVIREKIARQEVPAAPVPAL